MPTTPRKKSTAPVLSLFVGFLMQGWSNASLSSPTADNAIDGYSKDTGEQLEFYRHWQALNHQELDRMRGGFSAGGKLQISFGFERLILVDGELAARTNLVISPMQNNAQGGQLTALPGVNLGQLASALSTPGVTDTLAGDEKLVMDHILPLLQQVSKIGSAPVGGTISPSQDYSSIVFQSNYSQSLLGNSLNTPLSMTFQNTADNRLIQSIQLLNIQLTNLGKYNSHSLNDFLSQQLLNR